MWRRRRRRVRALMWLCAVDGCSALAVVIFTRAALVADPTARPEEWWGLCEVHRWEVLAGYRSAPTPHDGPWPGSR